MKPVFRLLLLTLLVPAGLIVESCQSTRSATTSRMLKFNFEKGKGYDYEMIVNLDQEVDGRTMQMDMSNYYSMTVSEDDGNLKTITTRFERFKINMEMMGFTIELDSEHPIAEGKDSITAKLNKVNAALAAIKGRQFRMKVNAEGKVEEISGLKGMAGAIADSLGLDEKQKQLMAARFDQQFNDKEVQGQFEQVFNILPNKEVKVGDSWKKTINAGSMFRGSAMTSTYTVDEIEGDMVTLEEKTQVQPNGQTGMSGTISGTLVVDSRTGLVVNADRDITLSMTQGGKEVTMKGKSKIKGKAL